MKTSPASTRAPRWTEIRGHGHVLTPGRYVGAADVADGRRAVRGEDGAALTAELRQQTAEGAALDAAICGLEFGGLGYGRVSGKSDLYRWLGLAASRE